MENIVCSCNQVSEEEIIEAMKDENITDLDELMDETLAGTGCGRCIGTLEHLWKKHRGD